MFKNLRNKLIAINLGITTVVILIIFTTIYITSTQSANMRPSAMSGEAPTYYGPENGNIDEYFREMFSTNVQQMFQNSMKSEREAAASQLLTTLIISGLCIELAVALISYLLAEEAIKPVKEAYDSQKVFIANASHEIKTPLAAISANLEAADIHDNKFIKNVAREADKLTKLNTELLALARTDLVNEPEITEAYLDETIKTSLESFTPRMKRIHVTKHLAHEKVKINLPAFTQISEILLDNAVKYAESKITINLKNRTLTIANDGSTIPPEKIPHIYDRFYQTDKSSEGVGLGLAIARATADRNHWHLTCTSDKFTIFKLEF
ncbi:HAMP domain-containing histidine kinase [Candidatus Saccharibacteria bacterium]|nr:HAMP domain-containing histidine kinase [Candidatus Saccharibacteria bacterium]